MNLKSAMLFPTHARLIRESAGCGFHLPVYRATTLPESSQDPVYRGFTQGSVHKLQSYVKNSVYRKRFEISVVCSHLLLFFFVKEKTC